MTAVVRDGLPCDTLRAVTLLRNSHSAAGFDNPDGVSGFALPFDPAYAARLFMSHLGSNDRYCGVLTVGGRAEGLLLASSYEHPFGPARVAKETVWWIQSEHRGRSAIAMLDGYEAWAARNGCKFVGMAGMGGEPDVGRLYTRRGYRTAETTFLKAL